MSLFSNIKVRLLLPRLLTNLRVDGDIRKEKKNELLSLGVRAMVLAKRLKNVFYFIL